ncbi:hypothetical protein BH11ACT4_BH11ACT4_04310 [soil metagenome]
MLIAVLLIGALTALVFLVRAGDAGGANWPVNWELQNSDNGVLFQLMQDVAAGRQLDWSFSPQVYVFPELPVSALAFFAAGGSIYGYYLAVAVLNNVLMFLAIFAVLMMLHRTESVVAVLARAALAALPLVALPLLAGNMLLAFHLAPTYYFGMYLLVFAAPLLFLARRRWVQVVVACGVVLAAASNPLSLVFVFPAAAVVLVARAVKRGVRGALVIASAGAGLVILALVVRFVAFAPLQGTSPLAYMNLGAFRARLGDLGFHIVHLADDPASGVATAIGAILAVACLVGAAVGIRNYLSATDPVEGRLALVFLGLVPVLGLAGTFVLLITNHLYLWPAVVAPFSIALMAVPGRWVRWALPVGFAGFIVLAVTTGALANLGSTTRYFGQRSSETICLDENLPADAHLGYSTFSDARRVSLTSTHPFRLISILDTGLPSYWLTNRTYAHTGGSFFYLNAHTGEKPVAPTTIIGRFGAPDSSFSCGEGQEVLVYTRQSALSAIAEFYARQHP